MATTVGLKDDSGRLLAVVVDRAQARFFDVTPVGVVELPGIGPEALSDGRVPGDRLGAPAWDERERRSGTREGERRHLAGVIQRLLRLERERSTDGILLAGPGPAATALRRALPAALGDRVVGTAWLDPTDVTPALILGAAHAAGARLMKRSL
jgi:hypothetical protein